MPDFGTVQQILETWGVAVFLSVMYGYLTYETLKYLREVTQYMRERDKTFEENQKRNDKQVDHLIDTVGNSIANVKSLEDTVKETSGEIKENQQTIITLIQKGIFK